MEDYIKHVRRLMKSPRYIVLLTCLLLLYTIHIAINVHYIYCCLFPCIPCCPLQNIRTYHMLLLLLTALIWLGLGTASMVRICNVAHVNTTADIFERGSTMDSFGHGHGNILPEWELRTPNSGTIDTREGALISIAELSASHLSWYKSSTDQIQGDLYPGRRELYLEEDQAH